MQPWLQLGELDGVVAVELDEVVGGVGSWVLLCYRVPREPSTPRIAIWRKLRRLGVAQVGDGVAALPADARTREQLEWIAADVEQTGGTAMLWTARSWSVGQERALAEQMAAARATEYTALRNASAHARAGDAASTAAGGAAVLRRLRAELRRIERRDFFPPPERELARAELRALAEAVTGASATGTSVTDTPIVSGRGQR